VSFVTQILHNDQPSHGGDRKTFESDDMTKRKNNDLQNITHKTKDRVTRTPLKTGAKLI
jgi:hypothetical protein